jgi:hypothetical protein
MPNMQMASAWAQAVQTYKVNNLLNNCNIGLFTSPVVNVTSTNIDAGLGNGANQITEVTNAQLAGYARQNPTFAAPVKVAAGVYSTTAGSIVFSGGNTGTGATIYGWFLWDKTTGQIYWAQTEPAVTFPAGAAWSYTVNPFTIGEQAQ